MSEVEKFNSWLISKGKSAKTAKNYSSPFNGRLTPFIEILKKEKIDETQINNNSSFKNFCNKYDQSNQLFELNIKSKDMFRCSILWFHRFYKDSKNMNISHSNSFLESLREYQQSGDKSISGPEDWQKTPLIDIETELTKELEVFVDDLEKGGEIHWKFLLGSPGNGKSFLLGRLYRSLKDRGWTVKGSCNDYIIKLCQPNKDYAALWLLQDASTIKDAKALKPNYSEDTLATVQEARDKKISLIVCANRGVIERINLDSSKLIDKNLWKFLASSSDKKLLLTGSLEIHVSKNEVDHLSLFSVGELEKNPFDQIVDNITHEKNWKSCSSCEKSNLCPFLSNKKNIEKKENREKVFNLLRSVEFISGEPLVFRELLPLMSIIFSGNKELGKGPCHWVHENVENNRWVDLLSARFYMILFSPDMLSGLDKNKNLQKKQKEQVREIDKIINGNEFATSLSLNGESRKFYESSIGIHRVLDGDSGTSFFDPLKSELEAGFQAEYSVGSIEPRMNNLKKDYLNSIGLELKLVELIVDALGRLETCKYEQSHLKDYLRPVALSSFLKRWSSSFLFRFFGFLQGRMNANEDMRDFKQFINYLHSDLKDHSLKYSLEENINKLLNLNFGREDLWQELSEFLSIKIGGDRKYNIDERRFAPPYLKIPLKSSVDEKSIPIYISARLFIFLSCMDKGEMLKESMPLWALESLSQIRSRSLSTQNYSRSKKELKLKLIDKDNVKKILVATEVDSEGDRGLKFEN